MFTCWKWSTVIFVMQALVAGLVYFYTSDVKTVLVATTALAALAADVLAAFALATVHGDAVDTDHSNAYASAFFLAIFATFGLVTLAVTFAFADTLGTVADLATLATLALITTLALTVVVAETEEELFFPCFISALPLGVGTMLGGGLILFMWWNRAI